MSRRYGAGPVHLLAHLAAFGLIGWTVLQISGVGGSTTILLWFLGAVIAHDFIVLPLYSGIDRGLQGAATVVDHGARPAVGVINHIRVPAALSLVTLLAFSPLILGRGDRVLERVSTIDPSGYALRWVLLTVALFAISGMLYAARRWRAG